MNTIAVLTKLLVVPLIFVLGALASLSESRLFHFLDRSSPRFAEHSGGTPVPAKSPAAVGEHSALPVAIDHTAQVTVLGYHRFVDKVRRPDTEITPAEFEAQMQALQDQGIKVIPLDDFLAWRRGEKNIPRRSALITIDDGYNVGYTVAWPILRKFGYPFTLFIYTDYVRGGPKSGGGSMTWEQLAEMRDAGVSIQSHTVSHPDLRKKKSGASDVAYEDWLWNELNGSKEILEKHLGIRVMALAVPYGLANDHIREVAARAGYEMVFTVNGEKLDFSTPMQTLGRYMVQGGQPRLFETATAFPHSQDPGTPATGPDALVKLQTPAIQKVALPPPVATGPAH